MRYAIFSDIQGNRQAWEAILADMEGLQAGTAVCLGDVAGCGPHPREVLEGIRARTENLVMGDCDAAVAGLLDVAKVDPGRQWGIGWTREQLGPEGIGLLSNLPLAIKAGDLLFAHGETVNSGRFGCIDRIEGARTNFASSDYRVAFVGHGHRACVFEMREDGTIVERPAQDCRLASGRRYLVNVGSAGQPAGGEEVEARYAMYDAATGELLFRRVPFDLAACRADYSAAGLPLPSWLAPAAEGQPAGASTAVVTAGPGPPPPLPAESPPRRPLVLGIMIALLAVIGVLGAAGIYAGLHYLAKAKGGEALADRPAAAADQPTAPVPPHGPQAETAANRTGESAIASSDPQPSDDPAPAPEAAPAPVAVAPEPQPDPAPAPAAPATAVVPEPSPDAPSKPPPPDPGTPPIPPEPANAAAATPQAEGLLFYVPMDEGDDELMARDLVGDRDLDVAGGLPGAVGQIGLACRLEKQNGSNALLSEPHPLPELKAITISFWIRHPDPIAPDDADPASPEQPGAGKVPAAQPPMTLVSLKDFCEVRLEDHHVVADMDRQGAVARVAFPADLRWHHVLVENGGGKTAIWIDHRSQSDPVDEALGAAPPAAGVAVQIGSKGAHFHVDEVAIWNRKFTPVERQILYRNGRLETPVLIPQREIAYWKFDDESTSRRFGDTTGKHALGAYKSWRAVKGIAPDPVPLTSEANPQAAQVWQVAERPDDAGSFRLTGDAPFTYEGWFKLGRGSVVFLGGTTPIAPGEKDAGWRFEARPARGATGSLSFTLLNGTVLAHAFTGDLLLYDGRPHHIAAVWNPFTAPSHGTITIYLDRKEVGTASLALSDIGAISSGPFRIGATRNPVVLDELRFMSGALKPGEFLAAGARPAAAEEPADGAAQAPEEESVMQRMAREARERRAKAKADREARRKAEEARRNRE